ncbi:Dual specificity protein phosphatase 12 [Strongyloides ratti]|uniref:protein-tyrosine-phosphatase n=1 Tax=Strongyloides ratti TaxID=34506 RepID=A0A090L3A5_STRRB|nr:Dual specificity protein phosphatase 12 [Strongyloides ratti]CEF64281.1 Dual specificity protein phosphatase 12 [Strongyloides ratti]
MDEIITGLYISGADIVISSKGRKMIKDFFIKNIITISAIPIPDDKKISGIGYYFLFCMDQPEQDILGNNFLDNAINIIENNLKDGKLLIHCEQGISRSSTLCIAYLMKTFKYTFSRAFELMKAKHPQSYPNSGFIKQLKIFEKLNFKCNDENLKNCNEYKVWCSSTGNIPKICEKLNSISNDIKKNNCNIIKYRCRRCRNLLFNTNNLMVHEIGNKQSIEMDDNNISLNIKRNDNQICNFGYYLMPLYWMSLNDVEGKINCPKCNEKIGQYNWSGKNCIGESNKFCNGFITPWIYIQKGKVDEVKSLIQYSEEKIEDNSSVNDSLTIPKIIISS